MSTGNKVHSDVEQEGTGGLPDHILSVVNDRHRLRVIEAVTQSHHLGDPKLDAPRPYGLTLAHKHLPEMAAHTGLDNAPLFTPVVANFYKGLAVTVPLHLSQLAPGTTPQQLHAALAAHYEGERFVRVMPLADPDTLAGGFFDVTACNDTNRADVFVFANATQVLLACRLVNLGKGASGAAVQCMNVHLGVDEGLGL